MDDTSYSSNHAYVEEFVEGSIVTDTGFISELGFMKDLPIANILYVYYLSGGATAILDHNNTIYMGNDMVDLLDKPIQYE